MPLIQPHGGKLIETRYDGPLPAAVFIAALAAALRGLSLPAHAAEPSPPAGVAQPRPENPSAAPGPTRDLYPDLDGVVGMAWGEKHLPASALPLLRRNGFVVVPRFYRRLFSLYQGHVDWEEALEAGVYHAPDDGVGYYVTADSVLDTYHRILEDQVKDIEIDVRKDVGRITEDLAAHLHEPAARPDWDVLDADAAALAEAYFVVAARLLDVKTVETARFGAEVTAEVDLIRAAGEVRNSPLFGYCVDYTQFKPRGFYTDTQDLESFFRAMSWYGLIAFRIESETETRAAILIARAFHDNPPLRERWQAIDKVYTALLAPCDDLTPIEYAQAWAQVGGGGGSGDRLAAFKNAVSALRDPIINSMVFQDEERQREWVQHSKGLRLFGKRHIPDSVIFMEVTHPSVLGRLFPSGLDVLAANGSARARELALGSNPPPPAGYEEGLRRGAAHMEEFQRMAPDSCYAGFLQAMAALASPPPPAAPAFARTQAYADKNLLTALSSWASMRHIWQLQAKSATQLGGGDDSLLPGYVEPNPEFFRLMGALVDRTRESLQAFSKHDTGLGGLRALIDWLAGMAGKELANEPFSEEDAQRLVKYGNWIAQLQGDGANAFLDGRFPWPGEVADVHTEQPVTHRCLQVATGGAMPIYVIVEHAGRRQLMIGGVRSYYEFEQPIQNRMTDEAWRGAWDRGEMPALPSWTASFVSGSEAPPSAFRFLSTKVLPYVATACALALGWRLLRRRRRTARGGNA